MKKNDTLIDALFLLIYQIVSCLVVYFAAWLLVKIVSKFVVLDYYVAAWIYAVVLLFGVGALMCIYAYKMTYRTLAFSVGNSLLSGGLAVAVHLMIAAVFNYLPLLSGCPLYLSGILSLGTGFASSDANAQIPGYLPLVLFVVVFAIYHLLMLFLSRIAYNKRLMDRYELTGNM